MNKTIDNNTKNISPYWVTGLFDAEGNFSINYSKKSDKLTASVKITQLEKSALVLSMVKDFFGCGTINIDNSSNKALKWQTSNTELIISKIIPHFDEYPLQTSKYLDYMVFKEVITMFSEKSRNLKKDKILELKNTMNSKRSFEDKWHFMANKIYNIKLEWLQGFIDGEGCFYFYMSKSSNVMRGTLEIAQHTSNVMLLEEIKRALGIGYLKPKFNINSIEDSMKVRPVSRLIITDTDKIIEFIDKYPMFTYKSVNYSKWKKLIQIKKAIIKPETKIIMIKALKFCNGLKNTISSDIISTEDRLYILNFNLESDNICNIN